MVCYLEQLALQLQKDHALQARLHGFKTKAPVQRIKWTKKDNDRFKELTEKRYDELIASE